MSVNFGEVPFEDPDLAEVQAGPVGTIFQEITQALDSKRAKTTEPLEFHVTRVPELTVTYRLLATAQEFGQLSKASRKKQESDAAALSRLILAACCVGLKWNGEPLLEDNGHPMTWASKKIRQQFGATSSTEALTNAYRGLVIDGPGDGEIIAIADELVSLAGFGDDSQVWRAGTDPT